MTHDDDDDDYVRFSRCHVSTRKRSPWFVNHETKTFKVRGPVYSVGENFTKCWLTIAIVISRGFGYCEDRAKQRLRDPHANIHKYLRIFYISMDFD